MSCIANIRMELEEIYSGLDPENEEEEELRETTARMLFLISSSNLEKELARAKDLANAIVEFAEWQNTQYEDGETKEVVSRALWGEVSDYAREATQAELQLPYPR